MQIEYVARICFAARRAAQQQRHLAVGNSLFGQVIVNDEAVHAVVAEVFPHGAARVGREVLQRRRFGRGCGNDDGVFHRAVFFQRFDELRNGGAFLADSDINAVQLLAFVRALVDFFLAQDGIDSDGRFTGLAVADDKFALAAADGNENVERLDTRLHRLVYRFTRNNAGRFHVHAADFFRLQRAFAVDRVAKRVNNAAEQLFADGNGHDFAGLADGVTFFNVAVVAENNHTDVVGFKVQRHTFNAVREFNHLAGFDVVEAVNAGNAVTDGNDLTHFGNICLGAEFFNLAFQDGGDFSCADFHDYATSFIFF